MTVDLQRDTTSQFIAWAPRVCDGALGLLVIAVLLSLVLPRQVLRERVTVAPDQVATLGPIAIPKSPIGAMRIDVKAQLPRNTWVTFEIQVLDAAGNVLASSLKPAWREFGTWQEDGESGTWSEEDTGGRFDIRRATLDAPVTIAISSLEQGRVDGQPLNDTVTYRVTIRDRAIDRRFLWGGLVGVGILAVLSRKAVNSTEQVLAFKSIHDSDVSARRIMGGADKLVRMTITLACDETSPRSVTANVVIRDRYGDEIYKASPPIPLQFKREGGKIDSATGTCYLNYVIEPRASYGISVKVVPDGCVDRTTFSIVEGGKTAGPIKVVRLKSSR